MTRFQLATTAVLGALLLGLQAGCEVHQNPAVESRQATSKVITLQDLESELLRQFREQWPAEELSHVRIARFGKPSTGGAVQMIVSIVWPMGPEDTHTRALGGGLTLYPLADDYLVGTLSVEGKESLNVILKFN